MVRKTKVEVEQEATGFGKKEVAPKYSKSEILKSEEFTKVEQDFLSAFLSEGTHTIADAKNLLTKIRKGAVK